MKYSFLDIQQFAATLYRGRPLLIVPYGYTVSFADFDIGETQTQQQTITANADFILTALHYQASVLNNANNVSSKIALSARLLITDSGTNEQFTDVAVSLENYCSNSIPNRALAYPRFIQGKTTLNIQLTSFSAAGSDDNLQVDLFLEGVLVRAVS